MRNLIKVLLITGISLTCLFACHSQHAENFDQHQSAQMRAAANIVDAVNNKDAAQYGRDLHADVVVKMYDGEIRLKGRSAVIENRKNHFATHPNAHNKLIHLAEIDNRVVMHDKVWLGGDTSKAGANIVEVFTFKDNKIIQIDVIQPTNLFSAKTP